MNDTAQSETGQSPIPICSPRRPTFDELATAEPRLAEIEADILLRMTIPLSMPAYSRCFDAWILPRLEALRLSTADAEVAEDHLRVRWSDKATAQTMEVQP